MIQKQILASGECYYGIIALLEQGQQEYWTGENTGGLKSVQFVTSSKTKGDKRLSISIGDITTKKEEEILEFFRELGQQNNIGMQTKRNNSWGNLLELCNGEKDFFLYEFAPEKLAYIFSTYQGDYHVYQTNDGIECWSVIGEEEEEVSYTKIEKTIEMKKTTSFIIGDADKMHYKNYRPFKMEKGLYDVEIGYDVDDEPVLFRLKRK